MEKRIEALELRLTALTTKVDGLNGEQMEIVARELSERVQLAVGPAINTEIAQAMSKPAKQIVLLGTKQVAVDGVKFIWNNAIAIVKFPVRIVRDLFRKAPVEETSEAAPVETAASEGEPAVVPATA